MTPEREAMAQSIRQYLKLGLAVMPIRERTKLPVGQWEQHAQERPTAAQWNDWWREYPACNVAVVYAASVVPEGMQLVCVDTDTPEAEEWVKQQSPLPLTPTVRTAKGWHRYYLAPVGLEHTVAKDGRPEFRAGVHFTLLPPSIHPTGAVYEWEYGMAMGEVPVESLPVWGVWHMDKAQHVNSAPAQPEGDAEPVSLSLPEGTRNDGLFRQCAKWRALYVPAAQLRASAHAVNAAACQPPLHVDEVNGIVSSRLETLIQAGGRSVLLPVASMWTVLTAAECPAEEMIKRIDRFVNAAGDGA